MKKADEKTEEKIRELEEKTNLGIFASIVLAFTGGMTFSTSVLKYMGEGDNTGYWW